LAETTGDHPTCSVIVCWFRLSYRDVEELLAERSGRLLRDDQALELKVGRFFARELRRRRSRPISQWHLDKMAVMISGKQFWLWREVDSEGEVLDMLVRRRRPKSQPLSSCEYC
jgi:putative transposase